MTVETISQERMKILRIMSKLDGDDGVAISDIINQIGNPESTRQLVQFMLSDGLIKRIKRGCYSITAKGSALL